MSSAFIELDGSMGEGGGQILRTSLTLSLLTGISFQLHNIRAGRPKPGLQPQHLASVRAAATIGNAAVQGDHKGSRDLIFEPGAVRAGVYHFDIGTAGATGLVLQTIVLPLALQRRQDQASPVFDGPSEVTITGGTHVKASPCYNFLDTTWCPYLELMGLHVRLKMHRPGFYPRGGGVIQAIIDPVMQVGSLHLEPQAREARVTGFSAVAGLPESIAERQAAQVRKRLKAAGLRCDLSIETWPGGPGTVLGLVLHAPPVPTFFYGLGERGKRAERVADDAANELLAHFAAAPGAVDPHSADQILLPLALADGPSEYPDSCVTQHLVTNMEVVRRFIPREVVCAGDEGAVGLVTIR